MTRLVSKRADGIAQNGCRMLAQRRHLARQRGIVVQEPDSAAPRAEWER